MGDRNNPIKFGPEWLRNLSRERSAGSSASSNQNVAGASGASSSGAPGASGGAAASSSTSVANTNTANAPPKVQLAKLRYGREEMLALYDRTSEPPPELKYIDILYQPRGKAPVALNNTFEDDMRETLRSGPPIGGMSPGERFGAGRGRGLSISDGRGRPRIPFVRQPSTGRGTSWHLGSPRMPNYSNAAADDDTAPALRSWNTSNNVNTATRNSGDLSEWPAQKMFRSKRPGSNSNWRQPPRDEAEEWRSSEAGRSRSSHQDKWDRDWSDRPGQDKSPSWNSNRRTWVGDTQNDDNLPEWADSAEACTGTFDSSGAFHGYSNDDTNLPKSQEAAYPLTRSHTHGSFVRSKTAEEGSEEWWASEKAKKLSPKRFDASEIKFKKPITNIPDGNVNPKQNPGKEDTCQHKVAENTENAGATSEVSESNTCLDDSFNKKNVRFSESKTFDALMRSDINLEEATDERGNFQSVMITPNNSLRQKHQNIVSSISNNTNRQSRKPSLLQILQNKPVGQSAESDRSKQQQLTEDKLVDCLMNISLDDKDILSKMPSANDGPLLNASTSMSLSSAANSMSQMTNPLMQIRMSSPVLPNQGMGMNLKSNLAAPGIHSGGMQSIGITNSALNASLGLPLCPPNNAMGQSMGIPLHGVPPPILPSHGMSNPNMGSSALQSAGTGISGFPTSGIQGMHGMHGIHGVHGMHSMQSIQGVQGVQGIQSIQGIQGMSGMSGIQGMSSANIGNNSMFLGQNTNNSTLQASTDIPMPNHGGQSNMFPMHGLQHTGPPTAFGSSIYGNIMSQPPASNTPNQNLPEQWYYEDPKKNIQGPFTSKDMYNWYRAGFFSPSLMVRRTCDTHMRPLGSYGPVVPFNPVDPMYPVSGGFESRNQPPHDTLLTSQPGLGLDVDSLWSQPSSDLMWMQQAMNTRNENRVNNLPMFFWDQQPSAIASNSLLPEEIVKEMKTEDQILAQLRASQNINAPQNLHFLNEHPTASANIPEVSYITDVSVTPNLEDLQKLIEEDTLKDVSSVTDDARLESRERQTKLQKPTKEIEQNNGKSLPQASSKITTEIKIASQVKNETEKSIKNKENNNAKNKNIKKAKDEKKEEILEKPKEEDTTQVEKRQEELSLQKKRDDKSNKREQKEWIREGFTIVKAERNMIKDNRKRAEEFRAAEEAERKRKEEERMIFEEERKRRQLEAYRRQQEIQLQQQRQIAESVNKKAPWSTITNLSFHTLNKDGLTLAEIQRLEREKKLEQMREQQQMMHLIAQQQAASLAREQEMQAGLGWAKKKAANLSGQSLAEIQAETRKQAAAAASAQTLEDSLAIPLPPVNHVPWANSHNGGGFWDTQPPVQSPKQPVSPKIVEPTIIKKKPIVKQASPATEFEMWCTTALSSWSTKIDVPTFVAFLRDLESPYEIKDYVKCYLGDTKETNDFARHFLERRSKLLRVGMDTPSDDLCSPAAAINPRSISGSDDAKGKGKRTKKNKMLKVDARILGFSVTAAEDRINVGDIDLA